MRQKKRREIGEEERVTTRLFPLVPAYGGSSLAFCWSAITTNHVACLTRYRLRDDTCPLLDHCEKMLGWKFEFHFDCEFLFFGIDRIERIISRNKKDICYKAEQLKKRLILNFVEY